MPDFPGVERGDSLVAISTHGPESLNGQYNVIGGVAAVGTSAWTTANTAVYIPVTITSPFLAQKMAVDVATQAGNLDVGIYDEKGTRLVSKGSTAVAVAGLQVIDITDTWLSAGTYFIAMNCDSVSAFFIATGPPVQVERVSGIMQQAVGAVTLPSTATFATLLFRRLPVIVVTGATV